MIKFDTSDESNDYSSYRCLTYGDVLFDYCVCRQRIKFFKQNRINRIKIRTNLNMAYEVVKVTMKEEETNYVKEFYRLSNYNEKQALIAHMLR